MKDAFLDETARLSWQRAVAELPIEWRDVWANSLTRGLGDEGGVISLIGTIVRLTNEQELSLATAGCLLRPLYSHPKTTSRHDGELISIAVHADNLRLHDDMDYSWQEIQNSYRRIVLSGAGHKADRS